MTLACVNGAFSPVAQAHIPVGDRGFLLGDGLFETIRVANGQVCHLDLHLARLRDGLDILRFPEPDLDRIAQDVQTLCRLNALSDASLRLTVSRGCGPRGLAVSQDALPNWVITSHPPSATLTPAKLAIAATVRDQNAPLLRVKHTSYLPNILARLAATENGCDDALFLNQAGNVAETCSANIIALCDQGLLTPCVSDGALPGISRRRLIDANLCNEASLTLEDLRNAASIWLSTSLSLRQVACLGGSSIPLDLDYHARLNQFLFGDRAGAARARD